MVNLDRINQIAKDLDKLLYDFIPELKGIKIPLDTKVHFVKESYSNVLQNESGKATLFISFPQPFLADWVCKNKDLIKDHIFQHQDGQS